MNSPMRQTREIHAFQRFLAALLALNLVLGPTPAYALRPEQKKEQPIAGLEELRKSLTGFFTSVGLEERMEQARGPIQQIVQERQRLAVLMESAAASYASVAELARVARQLRRLNGYPVIEIKPLSKETAEQYRTEGYQVIELRIEPREPVLDRNIVYVRLPAGSERLVPKKFLPLLVTDAVALWQKAKGQPLSSPIILPAAPYLNSRGVSFREIKELIDLFA